MAPEEHSWVGCYGESWKEITSESFSHPAKYSRGLIRRIYEHALERGYLREGQTVLDPFGGIALGAADALANGLHYIGCELEQNFVDMGAGCDCTGISKDDWIACFGRWKRFAHKDGRHWCPRCLAEAGLVLEDWEPALPGMEAPTVSYRRSSGKIPHAEPHRYAGNLDLFARHARNGATAVLVQGDSRNLVKVLEGAGIRVPSLLPNIDRGLLKRFFDKVEKTNTCWNWIGTDNGKGYGQIWYNGRHHLAHRISWEMHYGKIPDGLLVCHKCDNPSCIRPDHLFVGTMSNNSRDCFAKKRAWIFTQPEKQVRGEKHGKAKLTDIEVEEIRVLRAEGMSCVDLGKKYGVTKQHISGIALGKYRVGNMPTGEPPSAIVSSPPFSPDQPCASQTQGLEDYHAFTRGDGTKRDHVMRSSGNIADMPTGEPPQAVIGSPPYAEGCAHTGGADPKPEHIEGGALPFVDYGRTDGQLAAMREGDVDAVIASPPYGQAGLGKVATYKDPEKLEREIARALAKGGVGSYYGNAPGQLGVMQEGDVDAVIASPPFAASQQSKDANFELDSTKVNPTPRKLADRSYFPAEMESDGQLAQMKEGDVDAVIASPPWAQAQSGGGIAIEGTPAQRECIVSIAKPGYQNQGDSDGQLAAMLEGEPPRGIVSSPPYEGSINAIGIKDQATRARVLQNTGVKLGGGQLSYPNKYGCSENQLGNIQGDTFWAAAKTILLQCYQVLAPGGMAIFVTKRFVRNKQIVEFSQQWADLCQSCGFELIEWIKAWLIEERGTQYDLEGEAHTKTVKRFSFFRRIHAQKYPHLAIEWEDILIFRKGERC